MKNKIKLTKLDDSVLVFLLEKEFKMFEEELGLSEIVEAYDDILKWYA